MKNLPVEIIISAVFIIIMTLINFSSKKFIDLHSNKNQLKIKRAKYVKKIISIIILIFLIVILSIVWSINYKELLIFASTFLTVCGVALFATWSILSNPLSSVIIFFFSTYKIEDKVKVLDGDNTITGKIVDMNLFVVLIEDDNQNLISYPNNLMIQKTVIKLA
ncbi:MAG: mechanosensitive ion channel domain-containing protein [Thermodesulfobacteriota bacterium]